MNSPSLQVFEPPRVIAAPLSGPATIAGVIELYLPHARRSCAAATYQDRAKVLGDFKDVFGHLDVAAANGLQLSGWVYGHEQWKSDWTLRRAIGTVQAAFNWAVKMGVIDRNPYRGVSHREGEPGQPMGEDHFRQLLRATSAVFRRVLIFQRFTGARPCEMSAVEWDFIDVEQGIIVLQRHKTRRTQREPKPRVIVLHPVVIGLLRWILEHNPHPRYVFVNARGRPWTRYNLALRMKRLRKKTGIPKSVKLYGLRYALACDALRRKVDLKTLSVLLGHTSVRMTQRYCRIEGDLDHLHGAVERIMQRK